jgi:mannose-6-phosphate isomerase-like protein (cupin superfamily)
MTIRVHHPQDLAWRRIGDIPMGDMLAHIDPSEQDCHLAFHEPGDAATPQLMEMRLKPHALVAPHSHDDDEIFYVAEGALHWGGQVLGRGGSMLIPAATPYAFRAGPEGARLLNFRARADHSFRPAPAG